MTPYFLLSSTSLLKRKFRFVPVGNAGEMKDDPYWISRANSLELIKLI